MTIQQYAEKHWVNTPIEVLKKAGINVIRSYRMMHNSEPEKIKEGEFMVFNYPDSFTPRITRVFNRMIKIGRFTPELKPEPKKRIAKAVYSTKS